MKKCNLRKWTLLTTAADQRGVVKFSEKGFCSVSWFLAGRAVKCLTRDEVQSCVTTPCAQPLHLYFLSTAQLDYTTGCTLPPLLSILLSLPPDWHRLNRLTLAASDLNIFDKQISFKEAQIKKKRRNSQKLYTVREQEGEHISHF